MARHRGRASTAAALDRRREVAILHLRGSSLREIAHRTGAHRATVTADLARISECFRELVRDPAVLAEIERQLELAAKSEPLLAAAVRREGDDRIRACRLRELVEEVAGRVRLLRDAGRLVGAPAWIDSATAIQCANITHLEHLYGELAALLVAQGHPAEAITPAGSASSR